MPDARSSLASAAVGLIFVSLAVTGCNREVPLGQVAGLQWWTDVETADLSGWLADGAGEAYMAETGRIEVVAAPAHSGSHAVCTITNPSAQGAPLNQAVLFRSGLFPAEAYYSAWFYLSDRYSAEGAWSFFKFRGRRDADDPSSNTDLWDLFFRSRSDGELTIRLFQHGDGEWPGASPVPVPIARWFHVEAFLKVAGDDTGRITFWQDGVQILEVAGRPSVPTPYLSFGVGNVSGVLSPTEGTICIDDAAVSLIRLGP